MPSENPQTRQPASDSRSWSRPDRVDSSDHELTQKITILWLLQHAPVRFWFYLGGLLGAAFGIGLLVAK